MTKIIHKTGDASHRRRRKIDVPRVLHASVLHAKNEAQEILSDAEKKAQMILKQAHLDAQQFLQRAEEETRMELATTPAVTQRKAMRQLECFKADLIHLAIKIAEKIIGEELKCFPEQIMQIAKECLKRSFAAKRMTLQVNPTDVVIVEQFLPELQALAEADLLVVKPDPSVSRGGCLLKSDTGQVDGRLESQLEAIRKGLTSEEENG